MPSNANVGHAFNGSVAVFAGEGQQLRGAWACANLYRADWRSEILCQARRVRPTGNQAFEG